MEAKNKQNFKVLLNYVNAFNGFIRTKEAVLSVLFQQYRSLVSFITTLNRLYDWMLFFIE